MSASIQKFGVSAVNAVAENNISLLHGNLDFALVKCQVPAELIPLGQRLSKQRRETAEDGSFHILARRLGILFEEILPSIPSLLRAYGTRASEITEAMDDAPTASAGVKQGVFGPHLGIDSTSIWASATSGPSALCMHLLACMLARIWSPQEATAIWVELVEHRRQTIKAQASGSESMTGHLISQLAAVHEIDRSTLEGWDASARAWLEVADSVKRKQQVQVQLIVNNISVAVKTHGTSEEEHFHGAAGKHKETLHENVILNLCRALSMMEKLVLGNPQKISDGGILLAMTSWYLYLDLVVLGRKSLDILQQDDLVRQGGVATISVTSDSDPRGRDDGVYWSLPLANLRYYGTVRCERSSAHDSKLSVVELQALALGASLDKPEHAEVAVTVLSTVWDKCFKSYRTLKDIEYTHLWSWTKGQLLNQYRQVLVYLRALRGGMKLFLSEDKRDQDLARHLIRYGGHYGKPWIGNDIKRPNNLFGMGRLPALLKIIQPPKKRVEVLLDLCSQYASISDAYVIRYLKPDSSWGYVSPPAGAKGDEAPSHKKRKLEPCPTTDFVEQIPPAEENWYFTSSGDHQHTTMMDPVVHPEELQNTDATFRYLNDEPDDRTTVGFDLVMGSFEVAGLFVRSDARPRNARFLDIVPIVLVGDLCREGCLDYDEAMDCLLKYFQESAATHGKSLEILGESIAYYMCHLPQTRVSIRIIKDPIFNWLWARSFLEQILGSRWFADFHEEYALTKSKDQDIDKKDQTIFIVTELAFAIILQFETGTISLHPKDLKDVMAISSGNSLFIAQSLLQDPINSLRSQSAVVHALGNVGKPGVALLHAPAGVEIREHDIDRWHVVSHCQFDGSPSDGLHFENTSLHMSFTGGKGPVSVGPSGFRGMEAYCLETKVSLFDGAEWVADLDILKALEHSRLWASNLGPSSGTCSHGATFGKIGMRLVSIDCWEEILNPPPSALIVRSGPSWMARLAALSIGLSKRYACVILPKDETFCWGCVSNVFGIDRNKTDVLLVY
ncbi:hypothetical protein BDV12DRAFT_208160 [Aspergillus spectabilis]